MTLEHWSTLIVGVAAALAGCVANCRRRRLPLLAVGVVVWFGAAWAASERGFFQNAAGWTDGDLVGFAIFGTLMTLPIVAFYIAWRQSEAVRAFASAVPLPALVGIEVYRVFGLIFWWLYVQGRLPAALGVVTGFADAFIGLTALPLAWLLLRAPQRVRRLAVVWNVLGIADFAVAVSVVSLSILGLAQMQPEPVMIGMHPLALIALFQLPLSIVIHVLALRRLGELQGGSPTAARTRRAARASNPQDGRIVL